MTFKCENVEVKSSPSPIMEMMEESLKVTYSEGGAPTGDDQDAKDDPTAVVHGSSQKRSTSFQKENSILKLLPYYDRLQVEADGELEKIVRDLAKVIRCQDFQVGFARCSARLNTYISWYGYRFSKELHLNLINIYLEFLTMETCPFNLILCAADILGHLLKRRQSLTRDDLIIRWRPLYETLDRCVYHSRCALSDDISTFIEDALKRTIAFCNPYFEKGTLPEVLAEFKPMLCPGTASMNFGLEMLNFFVPFFDPDAEEGINQLIEELLQYWMAWNNHPPWELAILKILAAAVFTQHRDFDWTPHLPMMYSRLMRNLRLPVYFKGSGNKCPNWGWSSKSFGAGSAARLIVKTLGNNPDAIKYLGKFLKSVETYYNSCNQGKWSTSLNALLNDLVTFFFVRVKTERYTDTSKNWWSQCPDDKKLTDEDITEFVKMISTIIFDYYLEVDMLVIRNLAALRPQLIIPAVMERYSGVVENVTEPNKYLIVLRWATYSLYQMMSSRKEEDGYDGRHFVLPLAFSLLPAIDPNDMRKTMCALAFIQTLFWYLPLVDCSSVASKLEDEEEKELCLSTSCLEDLVLQIVDRVVTLIEMRTLENTRMADRASQASALSCEDVRLGDFLWSLFFLMGNQSSTDILEAVVSRLAAYALSTTLDTEVSGQLFAGVIQSLAIARPDVVLPKLVPQLCRSVEKLVTDDILDEEELDRELLSHLLLLSHIMGASGGELLKYRQEIESMLWSALKLNGKKAYQMIGSLIIRYLKRLTFVYPLESRMSEVDCDDPEYIAIRDWGVTVNPRDINPKWHVPSQEELEAAKDLFLKIFTEFSGKLDVIQDATEENKEFNKRLLKYLRMLSGAFIGIGPLLEFWDSTPVQWEDTVLDLSEDKWEFGIPSIEISVPGTGENMRLRYYKLYTRVLEYLEKFKSDDTAAFLAVSEGLEQLLLGNVEIGKRSVTVSHGSGTFNALNPKKRWARVDLINRALDIHMRRFRTATVTTWSAGHVQVLQTLFKLCTNRYAMVRAHSQSSLFRIVDCFGRFGTRFLKQGFLDKLKDGVSHDEYKGTLYSIIGCSGTPLIRTRWEDMLDLWTAVVRSPFSEKKSIIILTEKVKYYISHGFIHYPLQQKVADDPSLCQFARQLVSEEEWGKMGNLSAIDSSANPQHCANSIKELVSVGSHGSTHWRKQVMAVEMLGTLISQVDEIVLTEDVVDFFFASLISPHIGLRRSAIFYLQRILGLFKREYPSVVVNTKKDLEIAEGESWHSILPYSSNPDSANGNQRKYKITSPITQAATPELRLHKIHHGFVSLPETIKMNLPVADYSDFSDQDDESRRIILRATAKYFRDKDYVEKLMGYWSLQKTFNVVPLVKRVTRNNGPEALEHLLFWAHQFGKDKDQWKQRCAAAVLFGIVAGMKLWEETLVEPFWRERLEPIFTDCLNSVTQETITYWSDSINCRTEDRDPNSIRFFIEFLRDRFIRSLDTAETTSVDISKEMRFFERAIANFQWRGGELYVETLALVKRRFFETPNPYRLIRSRLGVLLAHCFKWDISEYSPVKFSCELCPSRGPFVEFLFDALKNLEADAAKFMPDDKECERNEAIRKLLLKFKSALAWISSTCWEFAAAINPCIFSFIPLLCQFESYEGDQEVAELSGYALAGLSRIVIHPDHLDGLLDILKTCSELGSWRARLCVLEFLKVFALTNVCMLASREEWSEKVVQLALSLLSDKKLEVRETASRILCGFLHCQLVKIPMSLLSSFKKQAAAFSRQRREKTRPFPLGQVETAHSAILGLCAFVDTHPYQVPEYLPEVLVTLTTHVNDPQPIPGTIRKCLSNFRRTHHDNWDTHKKMFNEDQLCVLMDVMISPSYYA